jgi:hypothetical protein
VMSRHEQARCGRPRESGQLPFSLPQGQPGGAYTVQPCRRRERRVTHHVAVPLPVEGETENLLIRVPAAAAAASIILATSSCESFVNASSGRRAPASHDNNWMALAAFEAPFKQAARPHWPQSVGAWRSDGLTKQAAQGDDVRRGRGEELIRI